MFSVWIFLCSLCWVLEWSSKNLQNYVFQFWDRFLNYFISDFLPSVFSFLYGAPIHQMLESKKLKEFHKKHEEIYIEILI